MTAISDLADSLQECVDRYGRALVVPSRLLALHPRKPGGVGNAAALAPAITLGVISAFEGFVENLIGTALKLRGADDRHVERTIRLNNPDVVRFEGILVQEFPSITTQVGVGFTIDVWSPIESERRWEPIQLNWDQARHNAAGWMQVRHCLTHGLTSGWQSEVWPQPLRSNAVPATTVLKPTKNGKHSLVLNGAISCARIYRSAAEHLANLVAASFTTDLSWRQVPDFPRYTKSHEEYIAGITASAGTPNSPN